MTKVRDPVCMDVDTESALSAKIGDGTYYFCSQQCLDFYTAPPNENAKPRNAEYFSPLQVQ